VLRAHLARANDQLAELRQGAETLVMFQGPQTYNTPSWYAAKREHGRVVPTWNYVVVQARGRPVVMADADWLRAQLDALTTAQEGGRAEPWAVSDAPEPYIAAQVRGIVGVEIPIDRLEGKWKVSQNRAEADRRGVEDGLRREGVSEAMVRLVAQGGAGPSGD
jgi:transcriptional regulator